MQISARRRFAVQRGDARGAWLLLAATVGLISCAALGTAGTAGRIVWFCAGLAVCSVACYLLLGCRRIQTGESRMWRPVAVAGLSIAIGFAVECLMPAVIGAAGRPSPGWFEIVAGLPQLIACAFAYRGLVMWNRFRTATSDPSDWLNGLSSILALTGVLDLLLTSTRPLAGLDTAERQMWLLVFSATVVVVGTLASVAKLAQLSRDPRAWLLAGAFAVCVAGQVSSLWAGPSPTAPGSWSQLGWLLALALFAYASRLPQTPSFGRPSTTMNTTLGTLTVLVASVATLAMCSVTGSIHRLAACYAMVACLGSSARGIHIVRELSQLAQSRLEARTDDLTGIANRRALMARLEAPGGETESSELLLIDLNQFKAINDRYGHAVGDQLLMRIARRLTRTAPSGALLARLGGDEFAVLLPASAREDLPALADRLATAVRAPVPVGNLSLRVGVSIGTASRQPDSRAGEDVPHLAGAELLRRADIAMYVAKRKGNVTVFYSRELEQDLMRRADLADQIRQVLTDPQAAAATCGHLLNHYQVQIDAQEGRVTGVEALIRWIHPRTGLIAPDQFLPLVEEQGLMGQLTEYVLENAIRQIADWRSLGQEVAVAVNVSASSLADPNLRRSISTALTRASVPPHLLTIEITETALMSDADLACRIVEEIAAMGVGVSIDDYGTGYSSLAYLNDLAATEVKIDRSLIQQAAENPRTAAIIAGTIELAHRLGLRVVAEGIEDQCTHDTIRALGCDVLQGYFYGRPAEAGAALPSRLAVPAPSAPLDGRISPAVPSAPTP